MSVAEAELRQRISELIAENRRLAAEKAAAEQRLGRAAQVSAAVQQLHEADDVEDVRTVIKEIVANLVGSEEMGIFRVEPQQGLTLVDGINADPVAHTATACASDLVWDALASCRPQVAARGDAPVTACVPLQRRGGMGGAIVIFSLLPQKAGLEPVDHDLFEVLAVHGALALHRAALQSGGW
jgi:hypothetical protein